MPLPRLVRARGVSQRLRRETQHLGFSCLPGADGPVGCCFARFPRKPRRSTTRGAAVPMSAGIGKRDLPHVSAMAHREVDAGAGRRTGREADG